MESQGVLIYVSKLYNEGVINDDDRDKLKDMIFEEDFILLQLFNTYEGDEEELKKAIVHYARGSTLPAG